ncbi:MAG: glycoside hydrolase, partial [Clostridia bacterium]|nr:glycoside hydrolase [Clostridia bacterium]
KSHPEFAPAGNYWRGAVWAPTNYMVLKGLDQYGRSDLSYTIAKEHVDAVVDVFKRDYTLYENYTSVPGVDGKITKGTPAKSDFVGWTGLSAISILFEFVFGIKPDVVKNKITWHVNLLEEHGVQQYPFGKDGMLTLLCGERNSPEEKPVITVCSNVPVTLEIIWGDGNTQTMLISASSEYDK